MTPKTPPIAPNPETISWYDLLEQRYDESFRRAIGNDPMALEPGDE